MAVETYMTETEAQELARRYGGNPSWYWDAQRRSHVLIADGVTTPGDMGVEIAAGRGDPAAVADYFVMAAQLLNVQATFAVGEARQRDVDEETFYSQADLAAAEAHQAAMEAQLADLQMTAEDLHYTAEVQRITAEEAHDDRMAELAQRHDEVRRVYHLIFDKEHYAMFCEGDGAREDNYSDQTWETAQTLVDSGHTADSITAGREAAARAYPEPTPDGGKGDNELWARLNAAPREVQDEFWLVHPRPTDPDITEAMLAGAYTAVGLGPAAMASELVGADHSDPEYELNVTDDVYDTALASLDDAEGPRQQNRVLGQDAADVHADSEARRADAFDSTAPDGTPQTYYRQDGEFDALTFWSARTLDPDPTIAQHARAVCEQIVEIRRSDARDGDGLDEQSDADVRRYTDAAQDAFFAGEPTAAGYSTAAVGHLEAGLRAYAEMLLEEARREVGDVDGSDELLTEMATAAAEPGTPVPAEWAAAMDALEAEQQAKHTADVTAGKSADDVLAELIADLDATAPDPYPGDDVEGNSPEHELAATGDPASDAWGAYLETGDYTDSEERAVDAALGDGVTRANPEATSEPELTPEQERRSTHQLINDGELPPSAAAGSVPPVEQWGSALEQAGVALTRAEQVRAVSADSADTWAAANPGARWVAAQDRAARVGASAGKSADDVLAELLDDLDQARARLEAGDVPPEREHELAEYVEHLQEQAAAAHGDAALAAHQKRLAAAADGSAQDTGDEARWTPDADDVAHEAEVRNLCLSEEQRRGAEESPGKARAADAVAAAHHAVQADIQRTTEEQAQRAGQVHADSHWRGAAAGPQPARGHGGDSHE